MATQVATPDAGAKRRPAQIGTVTSDLRNKTITVEVRRLVKHPKYGKYIYRSLRFHAHDEKNEARKGDSVEILASRPISKLKRWRLVRILRRAEDLGSLEVKEVEVPPAKVKAQAAPAPGAEAPGAGSGEGG